MKKQLPQKGEVGYVSEEDKYFSTHDLALGSALIMRGYEMVTLDKGDPRKARFVFKGDKNISDTVKDFWDGRLPVDAQGYFNVIRRIKNQLYSE